MGVSLRLVFQGDILNYIDVIVIYVSHIFKEKFRNNYTKFNSASVV